MGEGFEASLGRRAREACEALHRAGEEGDDHGVIAHTGDLENLLRLARAHGIDVDAVPGPDAGD